MAVKKEILQAGLNLGYVIKRLYYLEKVGRGSSVKMVATLTAGCPKYRGSIPGEERGLIFSAKLSDPSWYRPAQLLSGYRELLITFSVEVKKDTNYNCILSCGEIKCTLINLVFNTWKAFE